jgi:glutathionyl-hydroquinone reductase
MFATAFRTLGTAPEGVGMSLVPPGREEEVDAIHKQWYGTLLNGVYRAVSKECHAMPCHSTTKPDAPFHPTRA